MTSSYFGKAKIALKTHAFLSHYVLQSKINREKSSTKCFHFFLPVCARVCVCEHFRNYVKCVCVWY